MLARSRLSASIWRRPRLARTRTISPRCVVVSASRLRAIADLLDERRLRDGADHLADRDHVADADVDVEHLAGAERHDVADAARADEHALAGDAPRGQLAEVAPGHGGRQHGDERQQREPRPRRGHAQQGVELLGRRHAIERDLPEDLRRVGGCLAHVWLRRPGRRPEEDVARRGPRSPRRRAACRWRSAAARRPRRTPAARRPGPAGRRSAVPPPSAGR